MPNALLQMVQQNDEKHEEGHGRLRRDVRALEERVIALEKSAVENRLQFARLEARKERRSELSSYKAVVIAASIGGGIQLIEVLINFTLKVFGH